MGPARGATGRHARAGVVHRPSAGFAVSARAAVVPHRLPLRNARERKTGLGAVAPPPPDCPRMRVAAHERLSIRRDGGTPPALVVGREPVSSWSPLVERDR